MHQTTLIALFIGLLLLVAGNHPRAEEKSRALPLRPFRYAQGFEEGPNPFAHWTSNPAQHTVNFMGLSEEKAASGRRSFKLDVTFPEPGYSYWGIPLKIPVEGRLTFSGKLLFLSGKDARAGLGYSAAYPKSCVGGCCQTFTTFEPTENWQSVSGDLGKIERMADGVQKLVWKATRPYVGAYLEKLALFIYVNKPTRVVVYVDDLEMEGEAPADAEYAEEVDRRWACYHDGPLRETMADFETRLSGLTDSHGKLAILDKQSQDAFTEKTAQAATRLADIRKKGWLSPEEFHSLDDLLFAAAEQIQAAEVASLFK